MLNHAKNDNFGTQCENSENIFLFLTDGEPTVGLSTFEDLKDTIDHFNTNINLFTYAFGSEADKDLLQQLSCEFNGIMFEI